MRKRLKKKKFGTWIIIWGQRVKLRNILPGDITVTVKGLAIESDDDGPKSMFRIEYT